jgi:polysaccharide deacetylase 2 family uncharacterized protein YibQ
LWNFWAPIAVGSFLILLMVVVRTTWTGRDNAEPAASPIKDTAWVEGVKQVLGDVLDEHGISWGLQNHRKNRVEVWQVRVPNDLPIPSLHLAIQEGLGRIGARVLFAESEPISGQVSLQIGWQDSCFMEVHLSSLKDVWREEGRIALIIDDFGDLWDRSSKSFLDLGADMTMSVLPGRKMSSEVARELRQRGFEVILHLPMEPLNSSYKNDGYIILASMDRQEILRVIRRSMDDVPGIVGVNNHMGSKVTSDRRSITNVLEELKAKNLYFVDSRTTAASVAGEVAQALGLRYGERDVFFDVEREKNTIRKRLWELTQKAKVNGFSIGIGHCQRMTLEVLQEEIPKIQAKGFRFVHVSEVVR